MFPIDHRAGRVAALVGPVDGLAGFEAVVEFVRNLDRAGRYRLLHSIEIFIDTTRLLADTHLEVAHVTFGVHHLSAGVNSDIGFSQDELDQAMQQGAGIFSRGEDILPLSHVPAQEVAFFHQRGFQPQTGDVQRRSQSGHPATDHQSVFGSFKLHRFQRPHLAGLGDPGRHHAHGLLCGLLRVVVMHPTILLSQADVIIKVGVQPRPFHRLPECLLMQEHRASANHDPVYALLGDIVSDQFLAWIGAHEHVTARDDHIRQLAQSLGGKFTTHHITDVAATVASVNADTNFFFGLVVFFRLFRQRLFRHRPRSSFLKPKQA